MHAFVLLSAFLWGMVVAGFMQYTRLGSHLAANMTWFMTALGCGGVLLLLLLLADNEGRVYWWEVVALFGVASVGPSVRGLLLNFGANEEVMDGARDSIGE